MENNEFITIYDMNNPVNETLESRVEFLRSNLSKGQVGFKYTKANGDTRCALGTTNEDLIIADGGTLPKGTGTSTSKKVAALITYYDLESHGWRSCVEDRLELVEMFVEPRK